MTWKQYTHHTKFSSFYDVNTTYLKIKENYFKRWKITWNQDTNVWSGIRILMHGRSQEHLVKNLWEKPNCVLGLSYRGYSYGLSIEEGCYQSINSASCWPFLPFWPIQKSWVIWSRWKNRCLLYISAACTLSKEIPWCTNVWRSAR